MENFNVLGLGVAIDEICGSMHKEKELRQLAVLVSLNAKTLEGLRGLFLLLDCKKTGYLDESTFISPFSKAAHLKTPLGDTWERFQTLFDLDHDGRISQEDFVLGFKYHALCKTSQAVPQGPMGQQLIQIQINLNQAVQSLAEEVETAFRR
mmetsp:Transcript_22643/g.31586  ORF Transcript_22643/g.31586 Transcript_22643/m.31586 type:complete len:151 (-) Transcript_22643:89-541(-)|eukprot:CAMPEP_0196592950 /NCGR_PEP_ID=MMETSP1081-20130531/74245_1 /TAXON_ID=36882 /ORGANISM="Pyramimonas amylifera, Strain CCMP720" /LENGTH=150 /DNA_ID=CAMNT_0041916777 /DNA_START=359 /DNA_END=811 /DNA_ORIENTATION=-